MKKEKIGRPNRWGAPRIYELRKHLSLSQEALARSIGVSYVIVNLWENNHRHPNYINQDRLTRLATETKFEG